MKRTLLTTAALLAMGIAPAMAEDGHVSHQTLSAVGLSGMQVVSDADGMQVRGMSSNAWSAGASTLSAQLFDPATGGFASATTANGSAATAENAGLNAVSQATHSHGSAINPPLSLNIATLGSNFSGVVSGQIGGIGLSSAF